jgi:hypothetical protein
MERARIFVGREGKIESYQLLADCNYLSASYDGSSDRRSFFEELSRLFIETIINVNRNLEVGTQNGWKMDLKAKKLIRISPLEEEFVAQLGEQIRKESMSKKQFMPAPSLN